MPTLEEFFANAIEQNDPEAMVEDQYKSVGTKTAEMTVCDARATVKPLSKDYPHKIPALVLNKTICL